MGVWAPGATVMQKLSLSGGFKGHKMRAVRLHLEGLGQSAAASAHEYGGYSDVAADGPWHVL